MQGSTQGSLGSRQTEKINKTQEYIENGTNLAENSKQKTNILLIISDQKNLIFF